MPILETKGLSKYFGGLAALDNIDLTIQEGEIRGIIGPNGAGKTTLFNVISGVYRPSSGQIQKHYLPVPFFLFYMWSCSARHKPSPTIGLLL